MCVVDTQMHQSAMAAELENGADLEVPQETLSLSVAMDPALRPSQRRRIAPLAAERVEIRETQLR